MRVRSEEAAKTDGPEKVAENQRSNVIMGDVFLRMYVAGA
jgi:hypothetical protein